MCELSCVQLVWVQINDDAGADADPPTAPHYISSSNNNQLTVACWEMEHIIETWFRMNWLLIWNSNSCFWSRYLLLAGPNEWLIGSRTTASHDSITNLSGKRGNLKQDDVEETCQKTLYFTRSDRTLLGAPGMATKGARMHKNATSNALYFFFRSLRPQRRFSLPRWDGPSQAGMIIEQV